MGYANRSKNFFVGSHSYKVNYSEQVNPRTKINQNSLLIDSNTYNYILSDLNVFVFTLYLLRSVYLDSRFIRSNIEAITMCAVSMQFLKGTPRPSGRRLYSVGTRQNNRAGCLLLLNDK